MAHWPRWIDSDRVDSQAMLGAYLGYLHNCEQAGYPGPWFKGLLWDILHREPPPSDLSIMAERVYPPHIVIHKPCRAEACLRCARGQGCYQFRWYSAAWASDYNRMRRGGSWAAPSLSPCQQLPYYFCGGDLPPAAAQQRLTQQPIDQVAVLEEENSGASVSSGCSVTPAWSLR